MLPKKNRVDRKEIDKIFKEGKFLNSPSLTFKFIKAKISYSRVSFIAPKSIAKLAVKRNSLRRKGYSALGKYFYKIGAGIVGVFIFKKGEDSIPILENEIKNIIDKIH